MTLPNGKPKAEARQREWEAFQKKKKKDSERRETLPLPTPWVKLPKREVRAWNLAATHAVTLPPHESGKTHLADPHDTHTHHATPTRPYPPRDTHICFSLHTQVFNLSFKISESVLLMFGVFIYEESVLVLLLFFWLCDYLIDESVFVFVNCDSVQLCNYII